MSTTSGGDPGFQPLNSMVMSVILITMSLATTLAVAGALISIVPPQIALATAGATTAVATACRMWSRP